MNSELEKLAKELRREYHKEWRAKNREKVREYDRKKWLRKAQKLMENRQSSGA